MIMTLKKTDGSFSLPKIALLAGVLASIATCVIALPIAVDYTDKAVAPWTDVPRQLQDIQKSIDEIKQRLHIGQYEVDAIPPAGTNFLSPRSATERAD
jgi:hypothetical protein